MKRPTRQHRIQKKGSKKLRRLKIHAPAKGA
jgi:hypothetical protein